MSRAHPRGHGASLYQAALLDAAQIGDRQAYEELVRRYETLIRTTVAKLQLPCGCERGDVAQEARIGLMRAVWAWRPARGPFRLFAVRCARGQALKAVDTAGTGKHQILSRAVPLNAAMWRPSTPPDDGELGWGTELQERLPERRPLADPVRTLLAREQLGEMRAARPTLTTKESAVLTGTVNGKSQQQLARELGLTEKAVERALRRARDKLGARNERLAA